MAKVRYTGKGALVKVNSNGDGTTMLTVGLCTSITPPPQEKATIDVTALEDTVAQAEQGIEQLSEFSVEQLHDPSDTSDDAIDTLYGNGNSVKWQLIFTAGTKVWTKDCLGRVIGIVPGAVDGNSAFKRTIKVIRNGAITDTVV
jgi:hypothetical protein